MAPPFLLSGRPAPWRVLRRLISFYLQQNNMGKILNEVRECLGINLRADLALWDYAVGLGWRVRPSYRDEELGRIHPYPHPSFPYDDVHYETDKKVVRLVHVRPAGQLEPCQAYASDRIPTAPHLDFKLTRRFYTELEDALQDISRKDVYLDVPPTLRINLMASELARIKGVASLGYDYDFVLRHKLGPTGTDGAAHRIWEERELILTEAMEAFEIITGNKPDYSGSPDC